jgi:hypothetical protein
LADARSDLTAHFATDSIRQNRIENPSVLRFRSRSQIVDRPTTASRSRFVRILHNLARFPPAPKKLAEKISKIFRAGVDFRDVK